MRGIQASKETQSRIAMLSRDMLPYEKKLNKSLFFSFGNAKTNKNHTPNKK